MPSRELQKMLTDPLHGAAVDWIVRNADEPTRQRMNSLTTPHATAWLTSTSLMRIMTQGEFVSGLKWGGGMKFRHNAYRCPNCGSEADAYGVHAVTCQRSGAISRGHTMLRDTVAELFTLAGLPVTKEQHLPQSLDRPADLLLSSWRGRTVALDFTIVTPIRASAVSKTTTTSTTTLMDQAAEQKLKKSQDACRAAGWVFQPFVADTFGALRSDARSFVTRFIKNYHHRIAPNNAEAGKAVWSAISGAVVSRAAQQLNILSITDSPLGSC